MPIKDKQNLIIKLVSKVLDIEADTNIKFPWFINQHTADNFKDSFELIDQIFIDLKGAKVPKRVMSLQCDAYFAGKFNLLFEFDELQHFSTARLKTLTHYPKDISLNYSIDEWIRYCELSSIKADKYRAKKSTLDFNFHGGRTCQRAYLDCFRDFLPRYYGLNPTLRINEFEVKNIDGINTESLNTIDKLLNRKLKYL